LELVGLVNYTSGNIGGIYRKINDWRKKIWGICWWKQNIKEMKIPTKRATKCEKIIYKQRHVIMENLEIISEPQVSQHRDP